MSDLWSASEITAGAVTSKTNQVTQHDFCCSLFANTCTFEQQSDIVNAVSERTIRIFVARISSYLLLKLLSCARWPELVLLPGRTISVSDSRALEQLFDAFFTSYSHLATPPLSSISKTACKIIDVLVMHVGKEYTAKQCRNMSMTSACWKNHKEAPSTAWHSNRNDGALCAMPSVVCFPSDERPVHAGAESAYPPRLRAR